MNVNGNGICTWLAEAHVIQSECSTVLVVKLRRSLRGMCVNFTSLSWNFGNVWCIFLIHCISFSVYEWNSNKLKETLGVLRSKVILSERFWNFQRMKCIVGKVDFCVTDFSWNIMILLRIIWSLIVSFSKCSFCRNPFSTLYTAPKYDTSSLDYGRPAHGSKTEARGIRAGMHLLMENNAYLLRKLKTWRIKG